MQKTYTNQILADLITLSRIIASIVAPFLPPPYDTATYIYAMFSDGIDGIFANPNKTKRWYDKFPFSFDEAADFTLLVSCVFYSINIRTSLWQIVLCATAIFIISYISSRPRGKKYTTILTTTCALSTVSVWWLTCLSLLIDFGNWTAIILLVITSILFIFWRIYVKKKQGKNALIWTRPNQPRS